MAPASSALGGAGRNRGMFGTAADDGAVEFADIAIWEVRDGKLALEAFRTQDPCGILAETLADKALSSSFVGAYAGALVVGEVLRGLHGGVRCEIINGQLRSDSPLRMALREENYQRRIAIAGFTPALLNRLRGPQTMRINREDSVSSALSVKKCQNHPQVCRNHPFVWTGMSYRGGQPETLIST